MLKLNILGLVWKIYCHTEESFSRKFGEQDAAFVLPSLCEAHFNQDELSLNIVKHEIFHMYRAGLLTGSASLSADQEEEVCAEMFSEHADKMLRTARILYKELKDEE